MGESLTGRYALACLVMIAGTALVVADTLIRDHTHRHAHTFTHTHAVVHSHDHHHYSLTNRHGHHHSVKALKAEL